MKKLIGILLALAMLLSLGTCAFAEEEGETLDAPYLGFHFVTNELLRRTQG